MGMGVDQPREGKQVRTRDPVPGATPAGDPDALPSGLDEAGIADKDIAAPLQGQDVLDQDRTTSVRELNGTLRHAIPRTIAPTTLVVRSRWTAADASMCS